MPVMDTGSESGHVLEIVDGSSELEWLHGDGYSEWPWPSGVERAGFAARIRVFHAMWEHPLPSDEVRTYDEVNKASVRRRFRLPKALRWTSRARQAGVVRDLTADTVVTGRGLGPSYQPAGWKRLRWAYLAARWDIEFDRDAVDALRPFEESLRSRSWPVSIVPPTEGSLDWDSFVHLLDLCMEHTRSGRLYRMPRWDTFVSGPLPGPLGAGTPEEMLSSYGEFGSGVNWWPADHSWLVYTDWDLCTTNILGSAQLISGIGADTFLEAHLLAPFTGRT